MRKGFPGSSAGKESSCNAGDPGLIPASGRSPGERISSVQSLSRVRLSATPWTAAGQASLSITNSRSLLKDGDRLPTAVFLGFPGGSDGKESACSAGNLGSIPRSGRSPGGGHGNPLQYSWASLVAQKVKNPPAMQKTQV